MRIKNLEIDNFRGFHHFVCDGFAPITLIGGRNNTGKSTVLEAISINSNMACFDSAVTLNQFRGIALRQFNDIDSLYWRGDTTSPFKISCQLESGEQRSLEAHYKTADVIVYSPPMGSVSSADFLGQLANQNHVEYRVHVKNGADPTRNFDDTLYFSQDGEHHFAFTRSPRLDLQNAGCYVSPRGVFDLAEIIKPLFVEKRMDAIREALREVDDRILDIAMFDNKVWANVEGSDKMLPIQSLGDGMLKMTTYLTLVLTTPPGGVVCIDEIENGLHYSAMLPLWRALVNAALTRQVQLVISSHNIEMMKQLSRDEMVREQLMPSGRFTYKGLVRLDDGAVLAKHYTFKQLAYALQNAMEVR